MCKKQKKLYQTDQGALVAGSSNVCKVATTSTDDDEEYFEPSKRPEITHTHSNDGYFAVNDWERWHNA